MHGVQTSTPEAGPSTPLPTAGQPELGLRPRLLDQVRDSLRRRRYSLRTEKVYIHWIRRFILFHGKRHPREMGVDEIIAFLNHLARAGRVSASTQNQALSALLGVVVLFVHVWTRRPLQALRGDGKWSARMYPARLKGTAFTCPQPP